MLCSISVPLTSRFAIAWSAKEEGNELMPHELYLLAAKDFKAASRKGIPIPKKRPGAEAANGAADDDDGIGKRDLETK